MLVVLFVVGGVIPPTTTTPATKTTHRTHTHTVPSPFPPGHLAYVHLRGITGKGGEVTHTHTHTHKSPILAENPVDTPEQRLWSSPGVCLSVTHTHHQS